MLSSIFGPLIRGYTLRLGKVLYRTGISPNAVTVTGLFLNALVALVLAGGYYTTGGICVWLAGSFDMLDGAIARAGNKVTRFGSFLDSTFDRYSEAVLLLGLLWHFLQTGNDTAAMLTYITFVGSIMISYTRARSEALGVRNETGLFARTERVVILGALLIIRQPVLALWILAIGTNLTAAQRVYHVYRAPGSS